MNFKEIGLSEQILRALADIDFERPTPVQAKTIPHLLKTEQDLVALAQTGTGKTAAFSLPIIEKIDPKAKHIQALILCPTRELCVQIEKDMQQFTKYLDGIQSIAVYGGERIDRQLRKLKKGGQIIVGTPGRINDMIRRKRLPLEQIKWLVLDEADEMLTMGFKEELDFILSHTPDKKQTLLFSATMPREIANIANTYMHKPLEFSVGEKNTGADNVSHEYYMVHAKDRYKALRRIADINPSMYGIVFCRTRKETQDIADSLIADNYAAEPLHGDLSQNQRDYVMNRFRKKQIQLLIATDVAARGIDVSQLSHVINYGVPQSSEAYVHRSGRTGRAHHKGIAITIINMRELGKLRMIEKRAGITFTQKKVPLAKDICEKQLFHLIDKIEKTPINEKALTPYLEKLTKKLSWMQREDLIKHFVSFEFNHFLEMYKNAPDINVESHDYRRSDKSHKHNKNKRGRDRYDSKNYQAAPSRNQKGPIQFAPFSINLGKAQQFNAKKLLMLVNKYPTLRSLEIGRIDVMQDHSVFEIDKAHKHKLITSLKNSRYQGIPIVVKSLSK